MLIGHFLQEVGRMVRQCLCEKVAAFRPEQPRWKIRAIAATVLQRCYQTAQGVEGSEARDSSSSSSP